MCVQVKKTANRFEISSLLEKILLKQVRWCLTLVGLYILLQLLIRSFTRLHQYHTMFITSSKVHNYIIDYFQLTLKLVNTCYCVWSHKTSLTPPLFIEVTVKSQK